MRQALCEWFPHEAHEYGDLCSVSIQHSNIHMGFECVFESCAGINPVALLLCLLWHSQKHNMWRCSRVLVCASVTGVLWRVDFRATSYGLVLMVPEPSEAFGCIAMGSLQQRTQNSQAVHLEACWSIADVGEKDHLRVLLSSLDISESD